MTESRDTAVEQCEPVFVVGMNGSGTSMMLDSLGRHPELYAVPQETLMMPHIIRRRDQFGDFDRDENFLAYWQYAIEQMPALLRFNNNEVPEIPANWQRFPRTIEGVFDGIFSSFAVRDNKRRWCEKTPDHVQHLPLLAKIFPKARFVHMIRDGREVACSIQRRQHRNPELVIYRWKKLVAMGRYAGLDLGDRYTELRYEDLTQNATQEMHRICHFLRLDFSESVLQSRLPQNPNRKRLSRGELGVIGQNPVKWPEYFNAKTVGRLEKIGGKTLDELGYAVSDGRADDDPGFLQRKIWRGTDFARLTWIRLRLGNGYVSWKNVLKKIVYSYKEYRSKFY